MFIEAEIFFLSLVPAPEFSIWLFLNRLMFSTFKTPPQSTVAPRLYTWENSGPFIVFCHYCTKCSGFVLWLLDMMGMGRVEWVYILGRKIEERGGVVAAFCPYILRFWTTYKSTFAKVWLVIFISDYSSILRKPCYLVMKLF